MPITIGSIVKGAAKDAVNSAIQKKLSTVFGKISGPLAALEKNKYEPGPALHYPLDIKRYPHWVKFNINIPERSKYTKTLQMGDGTAAGAAGGVANLNNAAKAVNKIGGNVVSGGGAVAAGVATGILSKGAAVIKNIVKGKVSAAIGASVAGGAAGAVTGIAVSTLTSERKTKRIAQTIFLYVPDTITNQVVATYDSVSLTEAMGKAGAIAQGADAVGTSVKDMIENKSFGAGKSAATTGTAIEAAVAASGGNFGAGIQDALLKSQGIAQNPQIDVIFKSIGNREFQFDFKFTPTSQEEADEVLKILNRFRFHAVPELISEQKAQRYLIPPSEFDIEICFDGQPNRAVHKFSTCVLEGIDVNYVTSGQWATHDDGMPVEIALQLRFKEVEILHKKLIEEGY